MSRLVNTEEFLSSPLAKKLYPLIRPIADRFMGFHILNKHYENIISKSAVSKWSFSKQALENFQATYQTDLKLKEELKIERPCIFVANHPYGCIDAMAMMELAEECRPGNWKIVANRLLRNVEAISHQIIVVDPFAEGEAKRANLTAIKQMHKILKSGGMLILFPARRVSGLSDDINAICDLPWSNHPLKFALQHKATIVQAHVSGHNSNKFLKIPAEQLKRRSIRLAKEVDLQRNQKLYLSYSKTMRPQQVEKINKLANKEEILLAHTYIGADKTEVTPATTVESVRDDTSHQNFLDVLTASQSVIVAHPEFSSFCFQGKEEPEVMHEIGRLRELTFSAIGAGSGNTIDLSEEDNYYHHIVVTEKATGKIAGAYRIGFTKGIIENHGIEGLYLNHIFDFTSQFYQQVGHAMELSRSFIPVEFQKSPHVLDILWKSLGKVATQHQCKKLYGSVTISADYTPLSQSIIVETLDSYHAAPKDICATVTNSNKFTATTQYHKLLADAYAPHGLNRLNQVIEEIEENQRSIPPLIRYYATLGAKFLSFKVEPTFNNAIYCLLLVDLEQIPSRYKKRFLE